MKKSPIEKLHTKIKNLLNDSNIEHNENKIIIENCVIFEYDNKEIKYSYWRYYPNKIEFLVKVSYKVIINIENGNLDILNSNIINPPNDAKKIIDVFNNLTDIEFENLIIGESNNFIKGKTLALTKDFYEILCLILKEENKEKNVRIKNRIAPLVKENFGINLGIYNLDRDYSLIIKELLASGAFNQKDLMDLTDKLGHGNENNLVIEKQIKKQTQWLIDTLQEIIDQPKLTTEIAKDLGNKHFMYSKSSIKGPEHLMEKILTQYGKNTFFGAPVLINTKKYVISKKNISRSQFDILLINQQNDIDVIELKRPDTTLLNYDFGRNKFYASKDLSIAISQCERYISAILRDNDEEYLIDAKKIRDFINDLVSGIAEIDICRPSAIIIIGSYQSIVEDYNKLSDNEKSRISREEYSVNSWQAYKELKSAFKNIKIMTYSELIENARLRLA